MSEVNRNSLGYWFPLIEAVGVPVPKTRIVYTDIDLTQLLDGQIPEGFEGLVRAITRAGDDVGGRPFFLRTGHGSGKHGWRDTCYVGKEHAISRHIGALVEWSNSVDLIGLPTDVWAARELLPTEPLFRCTKYGDFPVTREFRVFVRDGDVEHVQPYWPEGAVEQGDPDDATWREALRAASCCSWACPTHAPDREAIEHFALAAARAAGGGYWSVDCLQTTNGDWFVTDMAEGERSFKWSPSETA